MGQPLTAPCCHPSCQPEGQCRRPAWQEDRVSATYHVAWTGVPQRDRKVQGGGMKAVGMKLKSLCLWLYAASNLANLHLSSSSPQLLSSLTDVFLG